VDRGVIRIYYRKFGNTGRGESSGGLVILKRHIQIFLFRYSFIIQNFQGKGMKRIIKVGKESEENFYFYVHNF
jgi:hypothetical protein